MSSRRPERVPPLFACWACGSEETSPEREGRALETLEPKDLAISDARYGLTLPLRRCERCGFRFAAAEGLARLAELYAALDDPGYAESEGPRQLQMRALVALARRLHPRARRALDVGAASGLLVREAALQGLDAIGIEPSHALAERARLAGTRVLQGALPHPELAAERFDLVFLVDVIEHVGDPLALLLACAERLAPEGRVLIVTPDAGSTAARLLGSRWWHYRLAHVGYFERRSLECVLGRAGLTPCAWRRASWFFTLGYLTERAERYLPIRGLHRFARQRHYGRRFLERVVPLNLRDSWVTLAKRATEA